MQLRNPNSETESDYSSSVLQLFNGGTWGRVEMSQFWMCIIYLYLVSKTLDLIISLRFNDIDVLIVVTTGFTGTRGTCYVYVFKETALTGFQDILPTLKVSLGTESPLQKVFSQYKRCYKSYCYYYFFKHTFLLNKEIKKTVLRLKMSWYYDEPDKLFEKMNILNTQRYINCVSFAITICA